MEGEILYCSLIIQPYGIYKNTITNANFSDNIVNADYSSNEIENENNYYRMRIKSDQELNKFPNRWQPKIIHIKKKYQPKILSSPTPDRWIFPIMVGWVGQSTFRIDYVTKPIRMAVSDPDM